MELWVMLAFASAFFAGITAILAKVGIKEIDSTLATAIRSIIITVFAWLMVWVTGALQTMEVITPQSLFFLVVSGMATGVSWLCYFKALQNGPVNKVTPIDKSSTLLAMLLAFVILREPVSLTKGLGLVGIGIGTYWMIDRKRDTESDSSGNKWLVYAILSAVFAALTSILGKIGITGIDSNLGTAIRTLVVLVMAWVMVFVSKKQEGIRRINGKSWLFLCLSGITTGLSWLCYYKALQDGAASVVVPIDKLSVLVTVLFSQVFLKERLTLKAAYGLLLLTAGTLVLLIGG